jgi:hypothetical protein
VNDEFLNWLENFESATDVSCLNNVSPDFMIIKVSQLFVDFE